MSTFLKKLKQTQPADYLHLLLFVLAILPAMILKLFHPHLWLICEYGMEARDNGYWLYKYIVENQPECDVWYAIDNKSIDYKKVAQLGKTIRYGTFVHWIFYLAAEVNISTHKGGKPNAAVCYLLEVVLGILKNKRVFLQHGITKDQVEMFYYPNTKMRLFICGAKPEYDFVKENFGYPQGYVAYTGFARFDELYRNNENEKMILVSPTWRNWLYTVSSNPYENKQINVEDSEYYQTWMNLLHSDKLSNLLAQYHYCLVFFPHRNMTNLFETQTTANIEITNWKKDDLQVLMKKASCMITDYSSSAMDFAYMNKAVLYYQFDYEQYRRGELKQGYFHYDKDGFGPVVTSEEQLLDTLQELLAQDCRVSSQYQQRIDAFFELKDDHNCQRIYQAISSLREGK